MAQTSSIYNQPLSGNLGNQTYKNYGGKQVVATRFRTTSAKGDGASRAQRDTRMLMPNLTLIGSQLKDWLPALWENNKFYKRPYTHFISDNMKRDLLVVPKQCIDDKRCIWSQLQVSCGTLPKVADGQDVNNGYYAKIFVPANAALMSMTLGDFTKYVISCNPDFKDGDFLVFVRVFFNELYIGSPELTYYSTPYISSIMLDSASRATLFTSVKGDSIVLRGALVNGMGPFLKVADTESYSCACVHVRKERGRYLASPQSMSWDFFGAEEISRMGEDAYLDYCASSWGFKDKVL